MKRLLAALGVSICLTACTSIQQPVAQVPLVSASNTGSQASASSSLQSILSSGTAGQTVQYQQTSFTLSSRFFSARGDYCRFMNSDNSRNLYCEDSMGQWFSVPAVLSNAALTDQGAAR